MEHKLVDLPLNRPLIPLILLCFLAACCAQNTYYVKPSAELQCPAEPCHTLTEYVEGAEWYFTNNTTMIFLHGDHTLQADIRIADVTDFTMLGDSSTLPDIRSRIVCTKPATVVFDNVSHVQVTFISFMSCGKNIRVTIPQNAEPLLMLIYGRLGNLEIARHQGDGVTRTIEPRLWFELRSIRKELLQLCHNYQHLTCILRAPHQGLTGS